AEAQLVALQGVGREPVVAASVAIGAAIGGEGQGQVAVVDQRALTDPLQHVAALLFQLHRLGGAAEQACGGQCAKQQGFHWALSWQRGHRCWPSRLAQPSSAIRALAAGCRALLPSLASTANSKS